MVKSIFGAFLGGSLGGVAGMGIGGGLQIGQTVKLEHTDLLMWLAKLACGVSGGLGAIAGSVVVAAGYITDAMRRIKPPTWAGARRINFSTSGGSWDRRSHAVLGTV